MIRTRVEYLHYGLISRYTPVSHRERVKLLSLFFHPDNVQRAARLQQLLTQIGIRQTDIANCASDGDKKQKELRAQLDKLVSEAKMETYDQLHARAVAAMTEEQKKKFNYVCGPVVVIVPHDF